MTTKLETLPNNLENNDSKDIKNHLQSDFLGLSEIFQVDEIGIFRLSKLVPEYSESDEIIDERIKRKIDFYRNFLGIDIILNIKENELFSGYKKVSIDIKGTYKKQIIDYIINNILGDLKSEGFQENFIAFDILKDVPLEILDNYKKNIGAESIVNNSKNTIIHSILWLESILLTREDARRHLAESDILEQIKGHKDLEDYLIHISHNVKLDSEFKETLELVYRQLLRYKNPKSQGLIRLLGHNVDENIGSKKLIDRTRSKFSISIAKVLGSFGGKSQKKALPNPNKGGEMDWTENQTVIVSEKDSLTSKLALGLISYEEYKEKIKKLGKISAIYEKNKEYQLFRRAAGVGECEKYTKDNTAMRHFFYNIDNFITGEKDKQGFYKLKKEYIKGCSIDLPFIIFEKDISFELISEVLGIVINNGVSVIETKLYIDDLNHGDHKIHLKVRDDIKYIITFHYDPHYEFPSICDVLIKKVEKTNFLEVYNENKNFRDKSLKDFGKRVADIMDYIDFEGIQSLEDAFINRKKIDLKSIFPDNISDLIGGYLFFDKDGYLYIEYVLDVDEIINLSDFGVIIRGLINGNFDGENFVLTKEKITFSNFVEFIKEIQTKLNFYIERDSQNGIALLLQENLEVFKNDKEKRQLLIEIIKAKKQETNPNFIDFYRELGKVCKEFRKFYTLSNISKIKKIQVLKTLLERNNLEIEDVWEYLSKNLKDKFLLPFSELFDYEIEESRFNELFIGIKKELEYLLGNDTESILKIFNGLYSEDNYLAIEIEINEVPNNNNPIIKDLKNYFLKFLDNRKKQIEARKKKLK